MLRLKIRWRQSFYEYRFIINYSLNYAISINVHEYKAEINDKTSQFVGILIDIAWLLYYN